MEFKGKILGMDEDKNKIYLNLETENKSIIEEVLALQKIDKPLQIEIKKIRNKRSNDSNSYLWVLCEKIAEVLHTNKNEIYKEMLKRYGQFTHIILKPEAVKSFEENWEVTKELGEVVVNGKKGIQIQAYFGSSTYDSKQMSILIDGIKNECHDLGIETLSDEEIENMNKEWGK